MRRLKKPLQLLLAVTAAMHLAACSKTKTVQWEEEVPLNTGETIVVKRSGTYTYESESGNPLKFDYRPDWRSTIEFSYKGKRYRHTEVVTLILLAIGPDGVPNLVADPRRDGWNWKHKYYCVTPSYVQFRPDSAGKIWTWPDQIEPWLYGLPTNLMFGLVSLESNGKRLTPADRAQSNASITGMYTHFKRIDPAYSTDNCPPRR